MMTKLPSQYTEDEVQTAGMVVRAFHILKLSGRRLQRARDELRVARVVIPRGLDRGLTRDEIKAGLEASRERGEPAFLDPTSLVTMPDSPLGGG
jgi:hypothetical protein